MAGNYLKHSFILNLVFSVFIVAIFFVYNIIIIDGVLVLIVFSGFAASFFIKENRLIGYTKEMIASSSLFSVSLIVIMSICFYFTEGVFWRGHGIFDFVTIFIIFFAFLSFFNLVGLAIGIIPKAIVERILSRQ